MNKSIKPDMNIQSKQVEKRWVSDFVCGLMGGLVSVTVCAPLDIARTRLNMMNSEYSIRKYKGFLDALKTIKKEEGLRGFYKGYNATVISIPLFHSLFFTIYNQMKPIVKNNIGESPLVIQHICASTITGFICDTLTNPLWVVRTRLQVQYMHEDSSKYSEGLFKTMRKIQQEVGYQFVERIYYYLLYNKQNQIKQLLLEIADYVLLFSRRKYQRFLSYLEINKIIYSYKKEGFKALYKGLGASLLDQKMLIIFLNKGLTHVAVYFPIYEYLKAKFEHNRQLQNKHVRSQDIFLASVISKLIACSVTYPHIVIRTRYGLSNNQKMRLIFLLNKIRLQDNRQDYAQLDRSHRIKIKDIVSEIVQKEGLAGLYRGLKVDLVRVLPANTITFVVYEYCKTLLEGQHKTQTELMH